MQIHIGIGIIDNEQETFRVALAGKVQLLIERSGHPPDLISGAAPLGEAHLSSFTEGIYPLVPQCRITIRMLDDGERFDEKGEIGCKEDWSSITVDRTGKEERHEGQ